MEGAPAKRIGADPDAGTGIGRGSVLRVRRPSPSVSGMGGLSQYMAGWHILCGIHIDIACWGVARVHPQAME